MNPDFFPIAFDPRSPAPAASIPAPAAFFPNEDLAPPVFGINELDPKVFDLPNPVLKLLPVLPKAFLEPRLLEDVLPKPVETGLGAVNPPPPMFEPNVFLVPKFDPNVFEPKDLGAVKPPPPKELPATPPRAPAPAAVLNPDPDLVGVVNPPALKPVDAGLDPKLPNPVDAGLEPKLPKLDEVDFGAVKDVPPIGVLVLLPLHV